MRKTFRDDLTSEEKAKVEAIIRDFGHCTFTWISNSTIEIIFDDKMSKKLYKAELSKKLNDFDNRLGRSAPGY